MYDELVKELRDPCPHENCVICQKAADAIEQLLKVASAMHTWIFLHAGDEQAAYDECGLTDEMNAELGYCGQFIVEPPEEES